MPKYIIVWNAGYGESSEVINAKTQDEANEEAYRAWLEEAQSNADHWAKPLTPELAADYDHEDELEEE